MSHCLYESAIEQIALELLHDENGYTVLFGPDLAEGVNPERVYSADGMRRIWMPRKKYYPGNTT